MEASRNRNTILPETEEKRAYFRIDTMLPFTFRLEDDNVQPLPRAQDINISVGGIGFFHAQAIPHGSSVTLALFLPSGPPIQAHAKVVRYAQRPLVRPPYHIGLQFMTLAENERERVNKYIFGLQVERRRTHFVV